MEELCVRTESGACRWCHNEEEYQKLLANGGKPIGFLEYLEGTKKEAEEELTDLLHIENCVEWYEAVDSAEEWTGFANFDDLASYIEKDEESVESKQNTVDFAIGNLETLIRKLKNYKETLEEVSNRLEFIQLRIEDIEEEKSEV